MPRDPHFPQLDRMQREECPPRRSVYTGGRRWRTFGEMKRPHRGMQNPVDVMMGTPNVLDTLQEEDE
jgi:hypothetical protein